MVSSNLEPENFKEHPAWDKIKYEKFQCDLCGFSSKDFNDFWWSQNANAIDGSGWDLIDLECLQESLGDTEYMYQ